MHSESNGYYLRDDHAKVQAISNLLNGAVKFVASGTKPKVDIRTERRNGDVRMRIENNGISIQPEYQHRLFNGFGRVHPENSDGLNGSRFWIQLAAAEKA